MADFNIRICTKVWQISTYVSALIRALQISTYVLILPWCRMKRQFPKDDNVLPPGCDGEKKGKLWLKLLGISCSRAQMAGAAWSPIA